MTPQPRAYVYVDGFNLFYRCLRKTSLKWLNIQALSEQMLPSFDVVRVKYYTAMIRSRGDPSKSLRQETYLRALRTLPKVEICLGLFSAQKVTRELVKPSIFTRIKKRLGLKVGMNRCVKVYDPKEKGSDVNLAVHIVNDAWQNRYDVAVLISNDSDLIEAIKVVRRDCKKQVYVINPHKDPNPELHKHADFVKQIRATHLSSAQFPDKIVGTKVSKPEKWKLPKL
jgi:uncharacterized LabA/DUF88 family protein